MGAMECWSIGVLEWRSDLLVGPKNSDSISEGGFGATWRPKMGDAQFSIPALLQYSFTALLRFEVLCTLFVLTYLPDSPL